MAKALTIATQVDALRKQIAKLQRERNALGRVVANRTEAEGIVRRWAVSAAAQGAERLRTLAVGVTAGGSVRTGCLTTGPTTQIDLTEVLAAVLGPDTLAAAVLAQIPEDDWPDAAGRALRLDELDREIYRLGVEEEALIVASEATPEPILRRVDVDPRVVLDLP
jgi:hypothetical protein